jgi:hypothetical protein
MLSLYLWSFALALALMSVALLPRFMSVDEERRRPAPVKIHPSPVRGADARDGEPH